LFELQLEDAVKIKRVVEVYQWIETREEYQDGDDTKVRYTYAQGWSEEKFVSASF